MMLVYMTELIRLSGTDPLWVTIALLSARSVTLCVVVFWIVVMTWGQLRGASRPSWPVTWPWALIGWMFAIAVQFVVIVGRVLLVGHIREQNIIGTSYQMIEIAVAIHLALWSVVAFWRWAHPLQSVSGEGAFASLAVSFPIIVTNSSGVIQLTTPAMDRLLGADGDELLGQDVTVIIPERWREMHTKGVARYLKTGESRLIGRVVQIDILRRDGTEAPGSLALSSAEVEGETWFIGAMWERTEERFHTPASPLPDEVRERQVRQDEQQGVLDETSLVLADRGRKLSNAGIALDERVIDMSAERQDLDQRQSEQDKHDKEHVGDGDGLP